MGYVGMQPQRRNVDGGAHKQGVTVTTAWRCGRGSGARPRTGAGRISGRELEKAQSGLEWTVSRKTDLEQLGREHSEGNEDVTGSWGFLCGSGRPSTAMGGGGAETGLMSRGPAQDTVQ